MGPEQRGLNPDIIHSVGGGGGLAGKGRRDI